MMNLNTLIPKRNANESENTMVKVEYENMIR